MRNLRKQIEKIYRKAAFKVGWLVNLPYPYLYIFVSPMKVVHDKEEAIHVTEENLKDFVGKPVFSRYLLVFSSDDL